VAGQVCAHEADTGQVGLAEFRLQEFEPGKVGSGEIGAFCVEDRQDV